EQRRAASRRGVEAPVDLRLRQLLEITAHLVVEVPIETRAAEERAEEARDPRQERHGAVPLRLRREHLAHREHDALPLLGLALQLPAPRGLEAVRLDAVAVLRLAPRADDGAVLLEAVEGGKEGAGLDHEGAARDLLDALGDREAVSRLERERSQDQEIERP